MLKKMMGFMFLAVAMMTLSACGDKPDEAGKAAVEFIEAVASGDGDKAVSLMYFGDLEKDPMAEQITGKFKMIVAEAGKKIKEQGGLGKVEVAKVEYSEDKNKAVVTLKTVLKNGEEKTENQNMIKVDGKWKVEVK